MLNLMTNFTYAVENRAAVGGLIYNLACRYYDDVIEAEAILASITAADRLLCIGGGICPFSAILFHQLTGAKVSVIDNNPVCVHKAAEVVRRLGLEGQVEVFHQDGRDTNNALINFADYSVVHMALQVSPIDQVLANLCAQIAPGTRLLMRRPKRFLRGIYSRIVRGVLADCPYIVHKSRNIGTTLLYVK